MRLILAFFCAALPAFCQFDFIATNADGSDVYFVTPLRQRGTGQSSELKLFRLRGQELSLLESRPCLPIPGTACGFSDIQASGDGSVVTFQGRLYCAGPC